MCLFFNEVLFWFQNVLSSFCIFLACITCLQRILGFSNTSYYQHRDLKGPLGAKGILKQAENTSYKYSDKIWRDTTVWNFFPRKITGFVFYIRNQDFSPLSNHTPTVEMQFSFKALLLQLWLNEMQMGITSLLGSSWSSFAGGLTAPTHLLVRVRECYTGSWEACTTITGWWSSTIEKHAVNCTCLLDRVNVTEAS